METLIRYLPELAIVIAGNALAIYISYTLYKEVKENKHLQAK